MLLYTKESLIEDLKKIRDQGWKKSIRSASSGGIGHTLEDLLGIEENNLPIPNAAEWELKAQRINTTALTTLFHIEPSPRAVKIVSQILLPLYGWDHKEAGGKYPADEKSFRQTINALKRTDRGFGIEFNQDERKVEISFDAAAVSSEHVNWLDSVDHRINLEELVPKPYWGFDDLAYKAGTKLLNCFYITAAVKRIDGIEHFHYQDIFVLQKFSPDKFIDAISKGLILIDFDARTRHNHGTKFRMRKNALPQLYENVKTV